VGGAPTGVLILNLGTPASPAPADVRRYLRQFLSDPYVIDLAAPLRRLLLEAVILPFRPRRSAEAYAKIWTPAGSPLRVHGLALRDRLAAALGTGFAVELGMRYGEPALTGAVARLREAGARRVVVRPLFPQYSRAATRSALDAAAAALGAHPELTWAVVREDFHAEPGFVAALAGVAAPRLTRFRPDHVLMSYHGLPERQIRRTDPSGRHCLADASCCDAVTEVNRRCYRAQCFATSRALAAALELAPDAWSTSFQSRLGTTPWIRPYTDHVLPELRGRGVARLAVLCPSFVADCLETLEEIGIRGRAQWRELGGEALELVPCLNADPAWAETLAGWLREAAAEPAGSAERS
jgi:ferrochelatase